MATLNIASKANQATTFPALLVAQYAKEADPNSSINVNFEELDTLKAGGNATVDVIVGSGTSTYGSEKVIDVLVQAYPFLQGKHDSLVGQCLHSRVGLQKLTPFQVKEWLGRTASFFPTDFKSVDGPLLELDAHLTLRSYVVGYTLTIADLSVWGAIRGNKVALASVRKGAMLNVNRWFKFIDETNPWIAAAVLSANAQAQAKKTTKSSEGASYDIALPDTEKGVVTRFPPEPS